MNDDYEVVDVNDAGIDATVPDPDPQWATEQEYRTMLDDEVVAEPCRPRPVVQIADGVRGMES